LELKHAASQHTKTISQVLITSFLCPLNNCKHGVGSCCTHNREVLCIIVQLSKLHLINSGTIKHTTFLAENRSTLTVTFSISVFSNNDTRSTVLQTDSGKYIPLTLPAHSLHTIIYKT